MSGHEQTDISLRVVVWVGIGLIVLAVVIHLGLWWMYDYYRTAEGQEDVRRTRVEPSSPIPPQPRLQVSPARDWKDYRSRQLEMLESYQWVSRETGKVRIPIERAMQVMVESENKK